MTQEQIDLLQGSLLLLATASEQSHTVLWQDAKRRVLAKALIMNQVPTSGPLGEMVRLRLIAQDLRHAG